MKHWTTVSEQLAQARVKLFIVHTHTHTLQSTMGETQELETVAVVVPNFIRRLLFLAHTA